MEACYRLYNNNTTSNSLVNSSDALLVQITDSILTTIVIILALLENAVVMWLLWKHRDYRTPTDVFVACLALSDLFVGLIPAPLFFFIYVTGRCPGGSSMMMTASLQLLTRVFEVTEAVLSCVAITYLAVLAFDRYFVIVHPFLYQRYATLTIAYSKGIIFFCL